MATKKTIAKIYKLNDEIKKINEEEGALYLAATANDKKITIVRNKKTIETTEKQLWAELRVTGVNNGDASEILKKKYPEVFEISEKNIKKQQELNDYMLAELGFEVKAMTIADFMKLNDLIVDSKIEKLEIKISRLEKLLK